MVPELSIVVLCYKSETFIISFIDQIVKEMEAIEVDYELILVANYDDTKDKTPQIAKDIAAKNDRVVVVSKEKGGRMGWDMRSGLEISKGKYIAIIDGDGQMPVSDIETVYTVIKTGQYDLVKTYRAYRYDGMYRKLISSVYNFLFKILFKPSFPLNDVNSKPKILTREAYNKMNLVSSDWFTDAEIMIETINSNLKICQISTVFYKNERRNTFVGFSTIFEFINNLFYYRFFKK